MPRITQTAWVKVIITSGQLSVALVSPACSKVSTVSRQRSSTTTHSPMK